MSELEINLHPECQALHDEIVLLREEVAHLLTEEHDLVHVVKPNLLAIYQQKIGTWELRRLQIRIGELGARRRLELAQAAVNQNQVPDWTAIDGQLELEFLAWQRQVEEAAERLEAADSRLQHLLRAGEDRELKKLYYALVRKLHPDLHPQLTEDQRRLWMRVQEAYQASDIGELRALEVMAAHDSPAVAALTALAALREDREVLLRHVTEMLRRIEQLEKQPPFTLRTQLDDDEWVAARRREIEVEITEIEARRALLEAPLQTLLKLSDDGKKFGPN